MLCKGWSSPEVCCGTHRTKDDDGLNVGVLQRSHVGVDGRHEHADVNEIRLDLAPLKVVWRNLAARHEQLRVFDAHAQAHAQKSKKVESSSVDAVL